jgi:5-methylcytosine-specific restriction endonuclease McrA
LETINSLHVLTALKRLNFQCLYCGEDIIHDEWHLDHVLPLALKGKNEVNNISPTCIDCNMMKHSLQKDRFIKKCKQISANFTD